MFEQVKDYKSACKVLGIRPIDKRKFSYLLTIKHLSKNGK